MTCSVRCGGISRQGAQKLVECLSGLSGKAANAVVKKPQCFRLQILACPAELEDGAGKKFLRNLENRDTIGYKSDVGNFPEAPKAKQKSEHAKNNESY